LTRQIPWLRVFVEGVVIVVENFFEELKEKVGN